MFVIVGTPGEVSAEHRHNSHVQAAIAGAEGADI
jgi:hypothetical protein